MNAQTTITAAATLAMGSPVTYRGDRFYICDFIPATNRTHLIGAGGFKASGGDYRLISHDAERDIRLMDVQTIPEVESAAARGLLPISADEVADLIRRADEITAKRQSDHRQREADRLAKLEAFRAEAFAKIPPGTKAVIIAELQRDDCDSMTDYFNAVTERRVIIALSGHERDLFGEMRKAAATFPETEHLATAPESAEHREKYSMGQGYYLKAGGCYSTGWKVSKYRIGRGVDSLPACEFALPVAEIPADLAAPGDLEISEHTHTKKGFQMFIVSMAERVDRATYDSMLERAKGLGGWYSKPWGKTPGGFAFKSADAARNFAAGADEGPARPETAPKAPKAATGEKFREMADAMQGEIDSKLNPNRLANTPKRQRDAGNARNDGYHLKRTQAALRALADLQDSGAVPPVLANLRTKAAVHDLTRSKVEYGGGYYSPGHDTGKPYSETPEALAVWQLLKPRSLEEVTADTIRAKVEALKFSSIPGYFVTPGPVLSQMVDSARLDEPGLSVLEPSGGSGAILDAVRAAAPGAALVTYERQASLCEILTLKGYEIAGRDFTESDLSQTFDRVLMNPPFEAGQDAAHVMRAFDHLKPGGRLVAVMSPGPFFRSDAKSQAFRAWFDANGGEKVDLPAGSFKESGTGTATALVILDRDS